MLSENDNQYCSAFLSAFPDLMFVLSTDGIFIDVHAGDREKLLLPPESFLNKSVHEVFGGVVADRTIDRIERLQATAEIQEYTYSLEIAEEERTFEARMAPYGRDDVLVVVRDITDKSRIASLAQEQEFYLSAIFQTTQDGIWVVDPQQRVVDVNESYCRMTGYSREEMLGMSIRDVDVDESPEETRARVERIIDCGRESFQARHRCKDGSLIDLEISATFMPLRGGRMVCFCRDVTERNTILKRVNHAHNMMRYVIEHTRSAVAVHDVDRCYVFVSQRYLEEFGLVGQNLIGRHHYEVFPDLPQRWRDAHTRALAGEVSSSEDDAFLRENGETDWTRWECRPWFGEDDTIQGFIVYTEVITEQKRREETLRKALEDAQAATIAKSQFLANMSHEIRTPMNGVLGFTELLSLSSPTDGQMELIESLQESGKRLMTLIDDILDFSRIEAGKVRLVEAPVDVQQMIESIIVPMKQMAERKGLQFILNLDPKIPGPLMADATRIDQVLSNLLNNAIKFTESGCISLTCELLENETTYIWLRVIIEDTGIGIANEQLGKVFEPFYQVEATSTRRFGGTGLGLTISHQLAKSMGGKLEITSSTEGGTRCCFDVPLKISPRESENAVKSVSTCESPVSSSRVLIVEDDPQNMKVAELYLQHLGLQFATANNGREALELLSHAAYDLILMDCRMPEMNGYETTEAIRSGVVGEDNQSIPIIALTAHAMRTEAEKCLAVGMNEHLAKPIHLETLRAALEKWLTPSTQQHR